jgi:hypothetical protein
MQNIDIYKDHRSVFLKEKSLMWTHVTYVVKY